MAATHAPGYCMHPEPHARARSSVRQVLQVPPIAHEVGKVVVGFGGRHAARDLRHMLDRAHHGAAQPTRAAAHEHAALRAAVGGPRPQQLPHLVRVPHDGGGHELAVLAVAVCGGDAVQRAAGTRRLKEVHVRLVRGSASAVEKRGGPEALAARLPPQALLHEGPEGRDADAAGHHEQRARGLVAQAEGGRAHARGHRGAAKVPHDRLAVGCRRVARVKGVRREAAGLGGRLVLRRCAQQHRRRGREVRHEGCVDADHGATRAGRAVQARRDVLDVAE
mmetsp:Transcript_17047/g.47775  ORF Transcript_17047/g.47775 Transcript_17047/m.47775 type:complete len:278 (+) Transcript_17047:39-872(+)